MRFKAVDVVNLKRGSAINEEEAEAKGEKVDTKEI